MGKVFCTNLIALAWGTYHHLGGGGSPMILKPLGFVGECKEQFVFGLIGPQRGDDYHNFERVSLIVGRRKDVGMTTSGGTVDRK